LAILTLVGASAVIQANVQPEPVGATTRTHTSSLDAWEVRVVPPPPPTPLPVDANAQTVADQSDTEASHSDASADGDTSPLPVRQDAEVLTGRMALLLNLLMLEKCERRLASVAEYTATFCKQERINGELTEPQLMDLKMRHAPFSVYMKWLNGDKGRQVLFVEGENGGKLLVKFGGWRSRLPALKLDPNGTLAMAESRHPITQAGILELVREAIGYRKKDLESTDRVTRCQCCSQTFQETDCYCFTIEYANANVSETYRKSILLIDKRSYVPMAVKNFTWPERDEAIDKTNLDDSTLIEFYAFSNVNLQPQLASTAFDCRNAEYRFR